MLTRISQGLHARLRRYSPRYQSLFRRYCELPHDVLLRLAPPWLPYCRVHVTTRSVRQLLVPSLFPRIPPEMRAKKRLAVLVPYRNRETHLARFIPHLHAFLSRQGISFRIYVIEQSADGLPFNRGKLLNAGFLATRAESDYSCFHDVDYLPLRSDYSYVEEPTHLSGGNRNHNHSFGGVTLFANEDFEATNGFDPDYWHWGAEDDELFFRCRVSGLPVRRLFRSRYQLLPHPPSGPGLIDAVPPASQAERDRFATLYQANVKRLARFKNSASTQADCMRAGLNTTRFSVTEQHVHPTHTHIVVDLRPGL